MPSDAAAAVADWIARVEARPTGWTIVKANDDDEDDEADEGAVADDRSVTPLATPVPAAPAVVPDIVVEGVRLAWRDGDDLIVRMPRTASRAQLKAVNEALGGRRFRRAVGCIWLDDRHFAEEVRLQLLTPPQTQAAQPVAVAA